MGSLEDTIKKLQQQYKNKPSPLSDQYIRTNSNVNYIPTQGSVKKDPRNNLLGNFIPPNDIFR
jgi:hypothetical protein